MSYIRPGLLIPFPSSRQRIDKLCHLFIYVCTFLHSTINQMKWRPSCWRKQRLKTWLFSVHRLSICYPELTKSVSSGSVSTQHLLWSPHLLAWFTGAMPNQLILAVPLRTTPVILNVLARFLKFPHIWHVNNPFCKLGKNGYWWFRNI